jgi:hypothetical protein
MANKTHWQKRRRKATRASRIYIEPRTWRLVPEVNEATLSEKMKTVLSKHNLGRVTGALTTHDQDLSCSELRKAKSLELRAMTCWFAGDRMSTHYVFSQIVFVHWMLCGLLQT